MAIEYRECSNCISSWLSALAGDGDKRPHYVGETHQVNSVTRSRNRIGGAGNGSAILVFRMVDWKWERCLDWIDLMINDDGLIDRLVADTSTPMSETLQAHKRHTIVVRNLLQTCAKEASEGSEPMATFLLKIGFLDAEHQYD